MNQGAPPVVRIAFFCLKFVLLSVVLLICWWTIQPRYMYVVGQIAGGILRFIAGIPIQAMLVEVDKTGVLNSKAALVYVLQDRRAVIDLGFLIANIPPFIALVLATPGLGIARRLRIVAMGAAVLFAGHVVFLVVMFAFARQVQRAPEVPTAFGLFLMTLPFLLWIVLAYWDRVADIFDEPSGDPERPTKERPPA